jgi:hypothetical protein
MTEQREWIGICLIAETAAFQWHFPTEVRHVTIPFEFHDLPLPHPQ